LTELPLVSRMFFMRNFTLCMDLQVEIQYQAK